MVDKPPPSLVFFSNTSGHRKGTTLGNGQFAINQADGVLETQTPSGVPRETRLDGLQPAATTISFSYGGMTATSVQGALQELWDIRTPIDSPAFTGTPTAPTPPAGDASTRIATMAALSAAITAILNAPPSTLDTLKELADALGDDPNFATTVATSLAAKAPLNSPALTGTPTAPTPTAGDSTQKLATTSFVSAATAAAVAALVNSSPSTLDTLKELADALGDDPNFATTIATALAGKQPLDADLTAIAALTTTSFGRSLLAIADEAAGRTALGAQATLTFAAASDVRTGTDSIKPVTSSALMGAAAFVADTWAATLAPDFSAGFNRAVTLGGNTTFGQPTNMKDGEPFVYMVTQDATGSRTIAFSTTYWKFPGGTVPTATTTAAAVDRLTGIMRNRSGTLVCEVFGYDKDIK